MVITCSPTGTIIDYHGHGARIWDGVTDKGVKCHLVTVTVAVDEDDNQEEFVKELQEIDKPSAMDVQPVVIVNLVGHRELAEAVADMRAAQKEYFKTREQAVLQHSKQLEKQVDALIDELTGDQPGLF